MEHVPELESTEYFHSRPHGSQIGAWVSNQSQAAEGREEMEQRSVTGSRALGCGILNV